MNKYDKFMKDYNMQSNCNCSYCNKRHINYDYPYTDYMKQDLLETQSKHKYFYYSKYWLINRQTRSCTSGWHDDYDYVNTEETERNKFNSFFEGLMTKIDASMPFGTYNRLYKETVSLEEYTLQDYYERGSGYILQLDIVKLVDLLFDY